MELTGAVVGIVGYGQTGREVARLAVAHGMRVLALKRHPDERRATGYCAACSRATCPGPTTCSARTCGAMSVASHF